MPLPLALSTLEQAAALGIRRAVFFGGEPLLYRGLEKLIRKASDLGFLTELDTNGALLTGPRVKKLKMSGLAAVMISLHGAVPGEHDRIAGPGMFKKAAGAIKLCSASGLLTYISTCVFDGRGQAPMVGRLIALSKRLGAHGIRLLPFAGRGDADPLSRRGVLALTRRPEAREFARTCLRSATSCDASLGRLAYVSPSGEVTRCPYVKGHLGNLEKERLSVILAKETNNGAGIFC